MPIDGSRKSFFKNGETICFIGNSITQSGTYHMLLQAYCATKFPKNKVKFISCGIGGDKAVDIIARLQDDVLVYKPNYAFVMTGMNDMYSYLYRPDIDVNDELKQKREEA